MALRCSTELSPNIMYRHLPTKHHSHNEHMIHLQNYKCLKFTWHHHWFQDLSTLENLPLQSYPSSYCPPVAILWLYQLLSLKRNSRWFHPKVKMQNILSLLPFTNYLFRNITRPWKPRQDFYYRAHILLQIMPLLKFIKDKYKGERLCFILLSHRLQVICQILPFLAPQ